jgi:hypothetical protein
MESLLLNDSSRCGMYEGGDFGGALTYPSGFERVCTKPFVSTILRMVVS